MSAQKISQTKAVKQSSAPRTKIGVVDFFCGCGGTSKGFQLAKVPGVDFEIIAGIDIDEACCRTFEASIGAKAFRIDIRDLYNNHKALERFKRSLELSRFHKLILIGCAPCQGFSAHRRNFGEEDLRNDLFVMFCRIAPKFEPDAIFIENVPDLFSKRNWAFYQAGAAALRYRGYLVQGRPYNFAGFGLPQERFRAVILASKTNASLPVAPLKPTEFSTVRQAIGHLPQLRTGERASTDPMHWVSAHRESTLAILRRVPKDGGSRPKGIERGLRLVGQFLRVHKWCLAVEAYAAAGCVGRFPQYTRSGVCPSSARWGRCWL